MLAPPARPAQCVGPGGGFVAVVVVAADAEEFKYFVEAEREEAAVFWCVGVGLGRAGRRVVVRLYLRTVSGPPFLALCAVMARNEWASMARAIWRCQALYLRTWYSSSPTSFLPEPKHSSMGQRAPATATRSPNPAWVGLWQ